MKKKIVLLMIPLLLLTGCKNKNDELFTEKENAVKEELKNIDKVTVDSLREKYQFLKDNYEDYKKSEKEEFIYNAKYIQTIGAKHENELTKLADLMLVYVKKPNKENFEALDISFKNVKASEDKLINDLYNSYLVENLVKDIINKKKEEVSADLKDKNLLTKKNLKAGINYIEKNIENPFKNQEVIENLIYYGMYFDGLSKKGNLKTLGTKTINYLKTLDDEKYEETVKLLSSLNKDKEINKVLGK